MCGILGYSGSYSPEVIAFGLRVIAHRGPDDSGHFVNNEAGIGLGHVRLSILDLSPLGHQPMADPSGRFVIVFNGEIYNFRELRTKLELNGCTFRGNSDTEVLLALYMAHREAMLPMLNGIFAFAIYDRDRKALFLACDAMGVKPLYFADGPHGVIFASELKALIACGGVSRNIDISVLFRTLGFLWSPGGATPVKGVSRLGPGEALWIEDQRIVRRWHWAASTWTQPTLSLSPDLAIRRVEEALRTAVHRQLVADVPVGAFLSGGLDSSAVVAMAREFSPNIECFTIDTGVIRDAGVTDDLPYARRVAKHLKVKLHEVRVDSARMASDLQRMIVQLDEPLADPAPLNVLYISELARENGVKVLLSGAGGDDVFAGYRRHWALDLERYWAWLPQIVRQRLSKLGSHVDQGDALGRRLVKALANAGLSADERLIGYFLWVEPTRIIKLFASDHRDALSRELMTEPFTEYLRGLPAAMPPMQRMLALEQRFFLADHNLLYTDKMSMAKGVEVRVPFLDNDLVQLANSLPPRLKQRGSEGKWILKKAMEPYLPNNVIYRPKTGFGAPLRHWLRNELRDWVQDMLSAETLRRRGLFDPEAVATLMADDRAGRVDAAYTILGLVCIEIWCREFMDSALTTGPVIN